MTAYYSMAIYLYKIALDDRLFPTPSDTTTYSSTAYDMLRIHLLSSCLETIRDVSTLCFSLPIQDYFSVPYFILGQQGHTLLILSRLAEVKFGTWDAAYVSSILDPKETMRQTAMKLREAMVFGKALKPPRCLPNIFTHLIEKLTDVACMKGRDDGAERDGEEIMAFMTEEDIMNGFFDFFDFGQEL